MDMALSSKLIGVFALLKSNIVHLQGSQRFLMTLAWGDTLVKLGDLEGKLGSVQDDLDKLKFRVQVLSMRLRLLC